MDTSNEVLAYWFGQWPFDEKAAQLQQSIWFQSSAEVDSIITEKFSHHVLKALNLNYPINTLDDQIACIILLDQFTRNIYRKNKKAFSGDHLALELCNNLIKTNTHLELPLLAAVFVCMPLQHSESPDIQERSVKTYRELVNLHGQKASGFLDFAIKHKAIIDEFGRYPHRNEILDRQSTANEVRYLTSGGERFGQ